jgi:hypothetical protein
MKVAKRRSTVYDFANLLLHSDGTRVRQSEANSRSNGKNKYAVKDHRGNWIAQDAGGLEHVKTRYAAKEAEKRVPGGKDEGGQAAGPSMSKVNKAKEQAIDEEEYEEEECQRPRTLKDKRAKRRKLFHADIAIHGPTVTVFPAPIGSMAGPADPQETNRRSSSSQQNPSSVSSAFRCCRVTHSFPKDLLKSIHYFASTYYTELGQLRDCSREYRKGKKLKHLKKLSKIAVRRAEGHAKTTGEDEESEESSSEESTESEDDSNTSNAVKSTKGLRNARRSQPLLGADMYKVFDGSALMAIGAGTAAGILLTYSLHLLGMLLQHHIEDLVTPRIPEGWEEAMLAEADESSRRAKDRATEDIPVISFEEPEVMKASDMSSDRGSEVWPVIDDSEDEDYVPK